MTDNKPILPTIDPLSYLRTAAPVWWGSLLAFLAAQIPAVAAVFAFIDEQLGSGWREIAAMLATAAVIFAYYWLARQLGRRWPAAEKWLIGSSKAPVYVAPEIAAVVSPEPAAAVLDAGEVVLSKESVTELETFAKLTDASRTTPPWSDAR